MNYNLKFRCKAYLENAIVNPSKEGGQHKGYAEKEFEPEILTVEGPTNVAKA